ncbi:MAG TPA: outer membrane protein transport protein [Balneolaceae bacterium]|nr:outer membrane protein transport protein [Balneolaceae bacterium]
MSIRKNLITVVLFLAAALPLTAQNDNNPLLFSNQAILLGDQRGAYDPVTMILPGMAINSGFGSFLDNPASVAMFDDSFLEAGFAFRRVDEDSRFLGNTQNLSDTQTTLSNIGFIYKLPTEQGSFVIGGGFNQQSFFNRALSVSGRNTNSTITDQFKIPGNTFEDIAFNTFAIDYGDVEQTFLESIFRIGFETFPGIRQEAEITNSGYTGEFSGFIGTEFQKNLFIGLSLGATSGTFKFDRTFLEIDNLNDFDGDFIDTDDDGEGDTDVDSILLSDKVRTDMTGFRARVGAIYKMMPWLNIGGSYTFPTRLNIDEEFDARILTTMDNGVEFEDDLFGEFSYSVSFPARVGLGFTVDDLSGFTFSFSSEYVQFSNTRINFSDDELFEDEQIENRFISDTFDDVWSFRAGAAYDVNPMFTLRAGYGYQPSRFKRGRDDRDLFSAGFGARLTEQVEFDLGAQLINFDETSTVYDFEDQNFNISSEVADRSVDRLQVLATLRLKL